ncbi:MAG: NusG domain II-containing protein [Clostridia bacterium]|nr:NusG domain II-containing protein [Clostridia bacterium]
MKVSVSSKRVRNDIILIGALLLLSVAAFFIVNAIKQNGKKVVVKQNNSVVYEGKLSDDFEVTLKHNTVKIKDGKVFMKHADCKNQICVRSGEISKSGETVVCLPNKVIIEIE